MQTYTWDMECCPSADIQINNNMCYDERRLKGCNSYLIRRLLTSAGDQSVKHMFDKHQSPKLMKQVVKRDNILPVMIRLPNEIVNRLSCKTGKLSG